VAETTQLRPARRRLTDAKKRPAPPRKPVLMRFGRAWINGSEVGGTDPRYAHLNRSYD
jgi:hypothetical protein